MIRSAALFLGLAACVPPPPPAAAPVVASEAEVRAWQSYLGSVERVLSQAEERQSGLAILETRAKLAEALAAQAGRRGELPRHVASRAGRLLADLDARFERVARRDAAPQLVEPAARAVASARAATPAVAEVARPEPEGEISEAEVDDGGPPVDIVLPAAPASASFRWPVFPVRITSGFGYRRDPLSGRVGFHDGLDLSVPRGTLVVSSAGGRVTFAGRRGGSGNTVVIRHAAGVKTVYAHLDKILATAGADVAAADPVGLVGSTGRATGPHLHFVVRMGGRPVNPLFLVGQERIALR